MVHFVVVLSVGMGQASGMFEVSELSAFDGAVRRRSHFSEPWRVTVVAVTEADFTEYQWPLSDALLARAIDRLQLHSPRAIGLDLYRNVAVGDGADALTEELEADNLVVIRSVSAIENGGTPAPESVPLDRVGFNDVPIDRDGVVRRQLLFATDANGELLFSLAARLLN
ncbi:CHASE2 domain-containing protein [Baaleninema sp.]|uniref:CHASE2 domain-containing protein n=1 Tax=Baaleninema sp. TaxID=3101197 RepID=UPI003D002698